ncbi:hypothetical protein L9F63_024147, partial [Diploptera punctata]
ILVVSAVLQELRRSDRLGQDRISLCHLARVYQRIQLEEQENRPDENNGVSYVQPVPQPGQQTLSPQQYRALLQQAQPQVGAALTGGQVPQSVIYQQQPQQQVAYQAQPQLQAQAQPQQYVVPRLKLRPQPQLQQQQQQQPQQLQQQPPEDYDPNPQYQFAFDVKDDVFTNYQNRKEQREGGKISGSYSVVDSDGFIRTVKYTADPLEGFKAQVTREPTDIVVKIPTPPPQQAAGPHPQQYAAPPMEQQFAVQPAPTREGRCYWVRCSTAYWCTSRANIEFFGRLYQIPLLRQQVTSPAIKVVRICPAKGHLFLNGNLREDEAEEDLKPPGESNDVKDINQPMIYLLPISSCAALGTTAAPMTPICCSPTSIITNESKVKSDLTLLLFYPKQFIGPPTDGVLKLRFKITSHPCVTIFISDLRVFEQVIHKQIDDALKLLNIQSQLDINIENSCFHDTVVSNTVVFIFSQQLTAEEFRIMKYELIREHHNPNMGVGGERSILVLLNRVMYAFLFRVNILCLAGLMFPSESVLTNVNHPLLIFSLCDCSLLDAPTSGTIIGLNWDSTEGDTCSLIVINTSDTTLRTLRFEERTKNVKIRFRKNVKYNQRKKSQERMRLSRTPREYRLYCVPRKHCLAVRCKLNLCSVARICTKSNLCVVQR